MSLHNTRLKELDEVGVYNAIGKDIAVYHERIQCLTDEEGNALCDVILEEVEDAYHKNLISDEMVRYLTSKILAGN